MQTPVVSPTVVEADDGTRVVLTNLSDFLSCCTYLGENRVPPIHVLDETGATLCLRMKLDEVETFPAAC